MVSISTKNLHRDSVNQKSSAPSRIFNDLWNHTSWQTFVQLRDNAEQNLPAVQGMAEKPGFSGSVSPGLLGHADCRWFGNWRASKVLAPETHWYVSILWSWEPRRHMCKRFPEYPWHYHMIKSGITGFWSPMIPSIFINKDLFPACQQQILGAIPSTWVHRAGGSPIQLLWTHL